MDKNLLVQIYVPTTDGKGSIGTGYPVAPGRILTARHVVFPENRDPERHTIVRWYHLDGSLRDWKEAKPIWSGVEQLGGPVDVAVVECPFPEWVGCGEPAVAKPSDNDVWVGAGFAKAGEKADGKCPPTPLLGRVMIAADDQWEFDLGVDYAVKDPLLWKGASGAPVFIESRIVGVIFSAPEAFAAGRLKAVPMWKLLQISRFREVVQYLPPSPAKPRTFNFSGKTKYLFTIRLGESWVDLANVLDISPHERRRFRAGYEAGDIWDWAKARKRLVELPNLLADIERQDLLALFTEQAGGD